MSRLVITDGLFVTVDPARPLVEGYMIVEQDRIAELGEGKPETLLPGDVTISGRGKLFMPGWVNTHGHAAMSLLRGVGDDLALQVWLQEKMWPNEAKYTPEDVRYGALLSMVEMLKGGTTCFVDMYDHMDEVAQAVVESGMRATLTRGIIGLCSPEERKAKLNDAARFAREWNGKAEGRIRTMMSPHSAYTCPPEFIREVVQVAHELDLPIHIHVSETKREVEENVRDYGARPVVHLEKLGVFTRPCLIAHAVHLNDEEIDILCRHDVRISHNIGSNLKLASGIARVPELLAAGLLVSLGTDGPASNNNLDMFEEARLAALVHKGVTGDPTVVPAEIALRMGTRDGAKSLWLDDVGMLRPGMKADFIALDIEEPHWTPHSNLVSHLIYAASAKDVTDVWVDGRQLVRNRECLTLDEEKIRFEAQRRHQRILQS